jgi:hypothetical protein
MKEPLIFKNLTEIYNFCNRENKQMRYESICLAGMSGDLTYEPDDNYIRVRIDPTNKKEYSLYYKMHKSGKKYTRCIFEVDLT